MRGRLERQHLENTENFRGFAKKYVKEEAAQWEMDQAIPFSVITAMAREGFFALTLPKEMGGEGADYVSYGMLNEALGRYSVSLTGVLNVHTMVCETLVKWGTAEQKERWLPPLMQGEHIGAFALTEPQAGIDLSGLLTTVTKKDGRYFLNGRKKWITYGAAADLFLVFGFLDKKPVCCLVPKHTEGLSVTPIRDMLGFRASALGELSFENCELTADQIIGQPGFAFTFISPFALDFGRISVAFAALGLLRGCLEECVSYSRSRQTGEVLLADRPGTRRLLTEMKIDYEAARHLCLDGAFYKSQNDPLSVEKIFMAKYFASKAAAKHSEKAVQLHGALGCHEQTPTVRFYRDSKTMEIIEGSSEVIESLIGKSLIDKRGQVH